MSSLSIYNSGFNTLKQEQEDVFYMFSRQMLYKKISRINISGGFDSLNKLGNKDKADFERRATPQGV